ncbi:ATP-binding protein [Aquiflexum lacus]|uniref:ATP-binding protein n=1 Tax=Aquiflexum lacus TaxID=2483805 RepID=UPI001894A993|nr:ATP-binding protein [Aquiflexum lacus]
MSERQNIEWKQSWHDDYLKWVCGFANAIGGTIYIGKDDKGNVVDLPDHQKLLEDIPNKIRNTMGIICDINLQEEAGKKFIEIKVNPYSVPVSLRGRYYYRTGSTKMELTGVELNEFLLKKAGKTWDDVVEEGASIKDIDEASIAKFISDSQEKSRIPITKGLSVLQILEKLQLTEGKKLKRAAILLFGKHPGKFYPNVEVRIGRFGEDATDLRFQEVIEGNLIQMLDEVQTQLHHKFLIRPVDFVGMQRVEKDAYPLAALREMLLNALVHRTYMGAHIQLRVFDDRLSIWNEGLLPHGLSLDDLKKEHNSRPRNPKIAKACFMAGYIETWGRGTLKIINACKEAGLPEPEIREMNGGIEITLFSRLVEEAQKGTQRDVSTTQVTTQVTMQVTTQVRNLLEVFEGTHNRQELQEKLGLANREHFRKAYLQPAIDLEFVALTVPEKPKSSKQRYTLTERGKNVLSQ